MFIYTENDTEFDTPIKIFFLYYKTHQQYTSTFQKPENRKFEKEQTNNHQNKFKQQTNDRQLENQYLFCYVSTFHNSYFIYFVYLIKFVYLYINC